MRSIAVIEVALRLSMVDSTRLDTVRLMLLRYGRVRIQWTGMHIIPKQERDVAVLLKVPAQPRPRRLLPDTSTSTSCLFLASNIIYLLLSSPHQLETIIRRGFSLDSLRDMHTRWHLIFTSNLDASGHANSTVVLFGLTIRSIMPSIFPRTGRVEYDRLP